MPQTIRAPGAGGFELRRRGTPACHWWATTCREGQRPLFPVFGRGMAQTYILLQRAGPCIGSTFNCMNFRQCVRRAASRGKSPRGRKSGTGPGAQARGPVPRPRAPARGLAPRPGPGAPARSRPRTTGPGLGLRPRSPRARSRLKLPRREVCTALCAI